MSKYNVVMEMSNSTVVTEYKSMQKRSDFISKLAEDPTATQVLSNILIDKYNTPSLETDCEHCECLCAE